MLTLQQVKEQGLCYYEYNDRVYKYKKDGGKCTLIENGIELISDADWILWYKKGVYAYKKDGEMFSVDNQ